MVKLLNSSDYTPMPWKNGGGVTSEIVSQSGPSGLDWRLSLADVTRNGPYSLFPGMSRVLTVVRGAGTQLVDEQTGDIQMGLPYMPITFSGDQPIQGHLIEGAIQNFNLIYNPHRTIAHVAVEESQRAINSIQAPGSQFAIYCLAGTVELEGTVNHQIHAGDTCIAASSDMAKARCHEQSKFLHINLVPLLSEPEKPY